MNIGMIPVRKGSQRLAQKNYQYLGNKLVFEYAIEKAINSCCFDRIIVNSEDEELEKYASKYKIDFYHREPSLATSSATSDQVVYDIFDKLEPKPTSVFWINTASPLSTVKDVAESFQIFMSSSNTSIVSVRKTRGHLVYKNLPINFKYKSGFHRTQDMEQAIEYNYAVMGWKHDHMVDLRDGHLFNSSSLFYPSSIESNFLLKNSDDLDLIKKLVSHPNHYD
jgi:CMP-N-acetylneuraminic acid synthetase